MTQKSEVLKEFHWLLATIQNIDVGLIVLDRNFRIHVWNGFMENHSGINSYQAKNQVLFDLFPDLDTEWFTSKAETVFNINNRTFTVWEQRPYLFHFKNYRPITGTAEHMYQNTTIFPLASANGEIEHISVMIYDVTDVAVNRLELKNANNQLKVLSRTDRLTGLNNRGYWDECLNQEFKRTKRTATSASLVMFDIDHFKKVNDTYGHQVGDDVIRFVSNTLSSCLRETDIAGRYGGEEFAVILINTDGESAYFFAERLRKKIENQKVISFSNEISITISLGIAEFTDALAEPESWVQEADQALYRAKGLGRNQTATSPAS